MGCMPRSVLLATSGVTNLAIAERLSAGGGGWPTGGWMTLRPAPRLVASARSVAR